MEVSEQIILENTGPQIYQGQLLFWVGEPGGEATVIAIRDEKEREAKDPKVLLSSSLTKEGLVSAQLPEEVGIKPNATREIGLLYTIFPGGEGDFLWQRKILYEHASNSLRIKFNPIEYLGYEAEPRRFTLSRSAQDEGWFVSEPLSPKVDDVYSLSVAKSEVFPAQPEVQEKIWVVIGERVRGWVVENLLPAWLINNIFILSLIGLGFWWVNKKR